jgi:hypothetical protein
MHKQKVPSDFTLSLTEEMAQAVEQPQKALKVGYD